MVPGSRSIRIALGTYLENEDWICEKKGKKGKEYSLPATSGFIEVHVYSLQLKIRVSMICASRINTVFIRYDLPKLSSDSENL